MLKKRTLKEREEIKYPPSTENDFLDFSAEDTGTKR